ncbi:amino acid deaminase [Microbacterium sp. UFMG61]|uniref:amino acid deaminase n=1 Tax=Microbacterium sp. UFMG61 TaxID=2745935 RepID=UPI00188FA175|nr:amino acid deaminase [Microbacterium sp. UFMG61]
MNAVSALDELTTAAIRAQSDSTDAARAAIDSLPWLGTSLDDDRAHGRFDAWGRSTVIDENIGAPVISRALFDELHRRVDVEAAWPVGNAGLLHCYGYLLSLVETPYGLKRERWIGSALAAACDLSPDAFLPWREGHTLLQRAGDAASAILAAASSRTSTVEGRRSCVGVTRERGPAALAYAVAAPSETVPRLITIFPVGDAGAVLTEFTSTPRLRWNAV